MSSHRYKPKGSLVLPAMMCGVAAGVLAIGLDVMGYFMEADRWLAERVSVAPFYVTEPLAIGDFWIYLSAIAGGWLVSLAVMDTVGWWRRWLVGAMSLVVAAGFCPVLLLWGVLWSPIVLVVSVLWGWFCAMVYCGQHLMPCEVVEDDVVVTPTEEVKVETATKKPDVKVETIPFPVPFKSVEKENGDERWQPKAGNGED